MTDAELAAHLADIAGKLLLTVRDSGVFEGKALGKAGDATANEFLCHALRAARPDDGLLSEEEKDSTERLSKSRVWIVDPVDGTREYGEQRSDWAVHVGLAIDGVAHTGAVALPGLDGGTVLRTDQVSDLPDPAPKPRFLVSRTRPAKEAVAVSEALGVAKGFVAWLVTATLDGILGLALGLVLIPVVNKGIVPVFSRLFPEKQAAQH